MCVEMCCRIPFVVELLEQSREHYAWRITFRGEIYSRAAPRRKSIIFKIRREKASFFDCGSIKVYLFVFVFLLSEMRIGRSRKAGGSGQSAQLGGGLKALKSTIEWIASCSRCRQQTSIRISSHSLAFSGASLKSGMTLENNRLSSTSV